MLKIKSLTLSILISFSIAIKTNKALSSSKCSNCMQNIFKVLQNEQWTGVPNWMAHFGQPNERLTCLKNNQNAPYLSLVALNSILISSILVWSTVYAINDHEYGYWWMKLTHLTLLLQTAYHYIMFYTGFKLRGINIAQQALPTQNNQVAQAMPNYGRATQVLQSLSLPSSLLVTLLYWTLVHDPAKGPAEVISYLTHGGGLVINSFTHAISNHPYVFKQGVYFLSYGLAYLGWTGIHHAANLTDEDGNPYLYKSIDWNKPDSSGVMSAVLAAVALPFTHLLTWVASNGLSWCFPTRNANINP